MPIKKSKSTFFKIKSTYIGSILNDKNNLHTNVNYVTYANSDLFHLLFKLMTSWKTLCVPFWFPIHVVATRNVYHTRRLAKIVYQVLFNLYHVFS